MHSGRVADNLSRVKVRWGRAKMQAWGIATDGLVQRWAVRILASHVRLGLPPRPAIVLRHEIPPLRRQAFLYRILLHVPNTGTNVLLIEQKHFIGSIRPHGMISGDDAALAKYLPTAVSEVLPDRSCVVAVSTHDHMHMVRKNGTPPNGVASRSAALANRVGQCFSCVRFDP